MRDDGQAGWELLRLKISIGTVAALLGSAVTCGISPIIDGELPPETATLLWHTPPRVSAPVFCIRKPAGVLFTLDDYMRNGSLSM